MDTRLKQVQLNSPSNLKTFTINRLIDYQIAVILFKFHFLYLISDAITQAYLCKIQRYLKAVELLFLDEKNDVFHSFSQNIDSGYT